METQLEIIEIPLETPEIIQDVDPHAELRTNVSILEILKRGIEDVEEDIEKKRREPLPEC